LPLFCIVTMGLVECVFWVGTTAGSSSKINIASTRHFSERNQKLIIRIYLPSQTSPWIFYKCIKYINQIIYLILYHRGSGRNRISYECLYLYINKYIQYSARVKVFFLGFFGVVDLKHVKTLLYAYIYIYIYIYI
jgi:hypothetical protein